MEMRQEEITEEQNWNLIASLGGCRKLGQMKQTEFYEDDKS